MAKTKIVEVRLTEGDTLLTFKPELLALAYVVKDRLNYTDFPKAIGVSLKLLEEATKHLDNDGYLTILKPNKEEIKIKFK